MAQNQVWHMFPTEDVIVIRAGPKLVICEANFANQKLLAGFCPCYEQGQLGWMQRGTAAILGTDEALQSVGHFRYQAVPYTGTFEMLVPQGNTNPRLLVFHSNRNSPARPAPQTPPLQELPLLPTPPPPNPSRTPAPEGTPPHPHRPPPHPPHPPQQQRQPRTSAAASA